MESQIVVVMGKDMQLSTRPYLTGISYIPRFRLSGGSDVNTVRQGLFVALFLFFPLRLHMVAAAYV